MSRFLRIGAAGCLACLIGSAALAQSSNPFSGISGWFSRKSADEDGAAVSLRIRVSGGEDGLDRSIRGASLLATSLDEGRNTGQDILAAARADYARILGAMYDAGYYSVVIGIALDGVEAARIAPLDAPSTVSNVVITVDPGPKFRFSRADIGPLVPGTAPSDDYRVGQTARSSVIRDAALGAVSDWRDAAHAKANVADTQIVADHNTDRLESRVAIAPGPTVTFGKMTMKGYERMNPRRLRKIAAFPEGEPFSPEKIEDVRRRLRATGVFSAITLSESDTLGPGNTLDVDLTVVEQKKRRVGAGFELSTLDGASISAYWLHRNMFGGAENLRIEIGATDVQAKTDQPDYHFKIRVQRPATLRPDITAYVETGVDIEREEDYDSDIAYTGLGLNYVRNEKLVADVAVQYRESRVTDENGKTRYRVLALPGSVTWDRRDSTTNPKTGFWLWGSATPFIGFKDAGSGAILQNELRGYRSLGEDDRFTFAGRTRIGTIVGSNIDDTPRDYLFYSGGGGTVRGHPFESLGVKVIPGPDGPIDTGGMSLAVANAEFRMQVRDKIGMVLFADAGRVWSEGLWQGANDWQAGAGIGVRYDTPIGPIRLDVAGPVSGDTGSGVQLYLGLGQAF